MAELRFPVGTDARPTFTSNGVSVLFATGADTQIAMMEHYDLVEKFGATLVAENIRLSPYWPFTDRMGAIYRLEHFPIGTTGFDYRGMLIFNIGPTNEYKKIEDESDNGDNPNVGKICEIIVSPSVLKSFFRTPKEWVLRINDDMQKAVENANKYLQNVIDELSKYR
ncbi:MAG: hypothetical protein K6E85_00995 [Lachnospiraceae bacterium]|nr:hypothetical protein [Lachnospiraceae bacterium]